MKRKCLNLGSADVEMGASWYSDFDIVTFDIDERSGADIIGDARELWIAVDKSDFGVPGVVQPHGQFDAVHVSHLLEHFYERENDAVLEGIFHVLKDDGMVDIWVPNIMKAARKAINYGIDASIYSADAGSIDFHQMLYGLDDNPYMAHHQGFDLIKLARVVGKTFPIVRQAFRGNYEIGVVAFKQEPTWHNELFAKEKEE